MTLIISFDPGLITGVATGEFSDDLPLKITGTQASGYEDILNAAALTVREDLSNPFTYQICESFEARTDNKFSPDLTGVRVEGVLDLMYPSLIRRSRTKKEQVPDEVLKEHGLWVTGKDVSWEDGRDVNDAIIHMLGFVAFDLKHKPTLTKYFKPDYGKVELR